MLIVIDPGHGGHDPGAVGPRGLKEKDVVLAISLLLAEKLNSLGAEVRLTREDDRSLLLDHRTDLANSLEASLLLSLHCNSYTSPNAKGVEIWHSYRGEFGSQFYSEGKRIAGILQQQLVQKTGLWNRGIKTKLVDQKSSPLYGLDYFSIIRKANCPALIVELGFISNPAEENLLAAPAFREKAARSLGDGLVQALNLKQKESPSQNTQVPKETTIAFEDLELKGFIVDGRSYVEVRKLAEAMGATVHWDPVKNRVEIRR